MTKTQWRGCDSDAQAIALGFPNLATYRHAVRVEIEREKRQMYADIVGQHNAEMAQKLQQRGEKHIMRTSPLTPQQEAAARARAAEYGQGEDR
jgi:hypothetical protein